ncbi:hypothetical protein X975_11598, partial [Stegodyphus mimosarum]
MASHKIYVISHPESSHVLSNANAPETATVKKVRTETDVYSPNNCPRFLLVSSPSGEMQKMSPFLINKYIHSSIGEPRNIKRLRSGDLLIDTTSAIQSVSLLKLTKLGQIDVTVSAHKTLNYSRGVISEVDLLSVSEEEFVSKLADQNVCAARRIKMRKEGQFQLRRHVVRKVGETEVEILNNQAMH